MEEEEEESREGWVGYWVWNWCDGIFRCRDWDDHLDYGFGQRLRYWWTEVSWIWYSICFVVVVTTRSGVGFAACWKWIVSDCYCCDPSSATATESISVPFATRKGKGDRTYQFERRRWCVQFRA